MVKPETLSAEHYLKMFRHLTGREPTAEEIEELRREMAADEPASAEQSP
jgi:hypothetical protein